MKVTKAQVQENRQRIVETASVLFREHGYDGVGVAELMAAAGFTHGGFYKHFGSKADLMVEAVGCSFAQSAEKTTDVDIADFVQLYLSRQHRDAPGDGCTMAALCADVARQPESLKAAFLTGIENQLATMAHKDAALSESAQHEARADRIAILAHVVGAIALSRACPDDSPLADEILQVCRSRILNQLAGINLDVNSHHTN
ncbi:TetR/AcrR family transcriptional regulator [Rheinheimera pacifica]|uniref:TetR/AcrR family transcriptional regulator n=1 Tax=Rheinheimera pacifica TaxID=173990 RepID=UPI002ED9B4BF